MHYRSPARLSSTLIYSGEGIRNSKNVHVLAYQNTARNEHAGPNAMIIPFPTNAVMGEDNVIDTRQFKGFLKDITNASKMQMRTLGGDARNMMKGVAAASAKVFDVGSYTVVLAEKASHIPVALERVPENKRPVISTKFLIGYSQIYKDHPIAVCCFDGTIEAEPLLWWYEPKDSKALFIPTMDAHDGDPPKLTEAVQTDHIISVGSSMDNRVGRHYPVRYKDRIPNEVLPLLPGFVYGTKLGSTYKNGDMFVEADTMAATGKGWRDIPKAVRGLSLAEATISGTSFEMFGWG